MKKQLLAMTLVAALGVSCLSGMAVSAEEAKAEGGNISIAVTADPQTMNPLYVIDQTSFTVMQSIYCPFFEMVGGEMYYDNGLCESVTGNEDASEYTLVLKEGLTWHDGEVLDADDVVFTMEVLVDEAQNVPYASYGFVDGTAVVAEKIDDLTVKLTLPTSAAGFLGGLSQVYCIPQHIYDGVENIGDCEQNNTPVGNGPFMFEEYKSGEYYKVTKFDGYFGEVNLDSITFKIVKDSSSANAALASGDLDARLISADDYDTVSAYENININSYNSGRVNAMFMNQNNDALKDVKVRQAIAYALNKAELCQFAYISEDFAQPAYSPFTPDTLYYQEPSNVMDNDQAKAKELLAEAGVENVALNLMYVSTDKIMESESLYIQSKLAEVGITINLLPTDESTFKNKTKDPECTDYDLTLSFYTLGEEPSLYADIFYSSSISNYSRINDAELDALWDEGVKTADDTARGAIYAQIQETINDNMYFYPISYSNGFFAVDKEFGGFDDCLLKTIYYDYSKIYTVAE